MTKFIVELNAFRGCGDSIECGTKVVPLDATTMEEAQTEVESLIEKKHSGRKSLIESAMIYEVTRSSSANINDIYRDIADRQKAARKLEDETKARAQLAALKKRFPNG